MACHGLNQFGPSAWPDLAWHGVERRSQLGLNPSSPLHPLSPVCRSFWRTPPLSPPRLLRIDLPHRCRSLHSTPPPTPPLPPWPSRLVGKVPSPRFMTWAARFCEVSESMEHSAPEGAPEWRRFGCGGGILWRWCGAQCAIHRLW
jgi:hypothetical protein